MELIKLIKRSCQYFVLPLIVVVMVSGCGGGGSGDGGGSPQNSSVPPDAGETVINGKA